jgi:hypothetical protein
LRRPVSPIGSQYTASSKSRASSPSMVTSGMSRRSTRPLRSAARTSAGSFDASASAASGHSVRDVELAHGDLDLHAGIVDGAEHLDHPSQRRVVSRGWIGDLDRHDLARLRVAGLARRDQDVVLDRAGPRGPRDACPVR